jgi:Inorganic pyrophosphatase
VKVLGTIALIDEGILNLIFLNLEILINKFFKGETDWKIIAIDVADPLAEQLNSE